MLPDGALASGSEDNSVRVWDAATGALEAALAGHVGAVTSLAVMRDKRLASGSYDRSVRLWDVRARACTAVLAHDSTVHALAALPCGGIAAGCEDGTIALWSAAGVRTATLGGGAGFGGVCSLAVLPDGRLAAGHSWPSHVIRVWGVKRRALDVAISGHTSAVFALAALPDGRLLSGSADRTIKVWDGRVLSVRGGAGANTCAATLQGHTSYVMALAVLPDGRMASGGFGADGTVRVWQ